MSDIKLYSTSTCPFCVKAKALLSNKGLQYTEINVGEEVERMHEMIERSGNRTVPQIFINNKSVGGFDELAQLIANGNLPHMNS